jgi:hypothetical protein
MGQICLAVCYRDIQLALQRPPSHVSSSPGGRARPYCGKAESLLRRVRTRLQRSGKSSIYPHQRCQCFCGAVESTWTTGLPRRSELHYWRTYTNCCVGGLATVVYYKLESSRDVQYYCASRCYGSIAFVLCSRFTDSACVLVWSHGLRGRLKQQLSYHCSSKWGDFGKCMESQMRRNLIQLARELVDIVRVERFSSILSRCSRLVW